MNRIYRHIALLFISLFSMFLMGSCNIYEDTSACTAHVDLHFQYYYQDKDLLKERIKNVGLYLFDSKGVYLQSKLVTADEYFKNTVPLRLREGQYHIVAVGNMADASVVLPAPTKAPKMLKDFYITNPKLSSGSVPGNDPIYLSEMDVRIPKYPESADFTMIFRKSHIHLDIFVKAPPSLGGLTMSIEGVLPSLYFTGMPFGNRTTYHPKGEKDSNNELFFSSNIFDTEFDKIKIVLRDSNGNILYEITLADYLKEHGIDLNVNNEQPIQIVIAFHNNVWIGVTVKKWNEIKVTPEY